MMDDMVKEDMGLEEVEELLERLRYLKTRSQRRRYLLGFDGFNQLVNLSGRKTKRRWSKKAFRKYNKHSLGYKKRKDYLR